MQEICKALTSTAMGRPPKALRIAWVHGGKRYEIWPDGRITLRKGRLGSVRHIGQLALEDISDLAAFLLAALDDRPAVPNSSSNRRVEVLLSRKVWARGLSDNGLDESPLLVKTWERLQVIQELIEGDRNGLTPMEVEPSLLFWTSMLIGGFLSFGLLAVVMLVGLRSMPQEMDGQGLTLRDGRRYRWDGVEARIRNAANAPNELLGCDLLTQDGKTIRLTLGGVKDGERVLQYALDRIQEART
jgi:hypothetical protein